MSRKIQNLWNAACQLSARPNIWRYAWKHFFFFSIVEEVLLFLNVRYIELTFIHWQASYYIWSHSLWIIKKCPMSHLFKGIEGNNLHYMNSRHHISTYFVKSEEIWFDLSVFSIKQWASFCFKKILGDRGEDDVTKWRMHRS